MPLFLLENSLDAADSLQTAHDQAPASVALQPPAGSPEGLCFDCLITLTGMTLRVNITTIRYTSKHGCKHAPWLRVNMLADWRNVKWPGCVSNVMARKYIDNNV